MKAYIVEVEGWTADDSYSEPRNFTYGVYDDYVQAVEAADKAAFEPHEDRGESIREIEIAVYVCDTREPREINEVYRLVNA